MRIKSRTDFSLFIGSPDRKLQVAAWVNRLKSVLRRAGRQKTAFLAVISLLLIA